jgi:hypothetical protein
LIKGFPTTTTTTTTTTTKQNVDPAVYYVYSRVKTRIFAICDSQYLPVEVQDDPEHIERIYLPKV